jgi:putative aminopeptidase FrvX
MKKPPPCTICGSMSGPRIPAEVAKLGIRVGHPAVYQDGPMELANKRIVGRALDNRIGGYIIAQVMKRVATSKKPPSHSSA